MGLNNSPKRNPISENLQRSCKGDVCLDGPGKYECIYPALRIRATASAQPPSPKQRTAEAEFPSRICETHLASSP
jgi:hypothetical protein